MENRMSEKTATGIMDDMRQDRRYRRATELAHATMKALDPFIADDTRRRAYEAVIDVYMQKGVEVITDYERRAYGLPERDEKGWTREEMLALEMKRLEILTKPLVMTVPLKD
jgi:hypothetical protein